MDDDQDSLFIRQFLEGEEKGFEDLVRKYQNSVLNIVYSLIGRDRESEDISQEVFLKVYHNLGSFRQRCRFSTWLYRIAVNTVYDLLRRRKNLSSDESAVENSVYGGKNAQEILVERENKQLIRRALANIPVKYRSALVLKDIAGMSYREISGVLRCGIGTVESRIFRGRQFLKEELAGMGMERI